jgi:hypothetical protein
MIPLQTLNSINEFCTSGDKTIPDSSHFLNGYLEAEGLPFEHFNYLLNLITKNIGLYNTGSISIENEIISVLTAAGITPNGSLVNQLLGAINYLIGKSTSNITPIINGGNFAYFSARTIQIQSCICYDSTTSYVLNFTLMNCILQSSGGWSAGNAGNKLVSGTTLQANTCYHVYLIRKTSDGTVDIAISTNPFGNFTFPAGYALSRLIGSINTDSGSNLYPGVYTRIGNNLHFSYTTPLVYPINTPYNGSQYNDVRQLISIKVADSFYNFVNIVAGYQNDTDFIFTSIIDPAETDAQPGSSNGYTLLNNSAVTQTALSLKTDANQHIAVRIFSSGNYPDTFMIYLRSYEQIIT